MRSGSLLWPAQKWRLLARIAFVIVLAMLFYAGLGPHPVPTEFHQEDKAYHLIGFAALAVSGRLAFPRVAWWWQVIWALAVGGGIELGQLFEAARDASLWDLLADAVGIAIGWRVLQLPTLRRWGTP